MKTLFIVIIATISLSAFAQDCVNCIGRAPAVEATPLSRSIASATIDLYKTNMCDAIRDENYKELGLYIKALEDSQSSLSEIYFNIKCGGFTLLQAAINRGVKSNTNTLNLMKVVMGGLMASGASDVVKALEEDIHRGHADEILILKDWIKARKSNANEATSYAWSEVTTFITNFYDRFVNPA